MTLSFRRAQIALNDTGTLKTLVPGTGALPANAVALTGIRSGQGSSNLTYAYLMSIEIISSDAGPFSILKYAAWLGTKGAHGWIPLLQGDQIQIQANLITAQAGSPAENGNVNYSIEFVTAGPNDQVPVNVVPFIPDCGDFATDCVVSQTSASATAQTIDIAPTQAIEYVPTACWFYTSANTATGNFGLYDGTTRVDIDTTSAVASYAFNLGAKGSLPALGGGNTTTLMFRAAVGAATTATTTAYLAYRMIPKK